MSTRPKPRRFGPKINAEFIRRFASSIAFSTWYVMSFSSPAWSTASAVPLIPTSPRKIGEVRFAPGLLEHILAVVRILANRARVENERSASARRVSIELKVASVRRFDRRDADSGFAVERRNAQNRRVAQDVKEVARLPPRDRIDRKSPDAVRIRKRFKRLGFRQSTSVRRRRLRGASVPSRSRRPESGSPARRLRS